METLTVALRLPRDLLAALDVSSAQLEPRLLELIALELFREGLISSGKGAEILELSKIEFVQLLAQRGICYFRESPEELAADVQAIELFDQEEP